MTTDAAVAELEVTETKDATPEPTKAESEEEIGTEPEATLQTDDAAKSDDKADEEDPTEVAIRSRVEAELETERERVREEEAQRLQEEQRQAQVQQAYAGLKQAFPNALREASAVLRGIKVADGLSDRDLTPQEANAILAPFEKYNLQAIQAAQTEAFGQVEDAIYASLPKAEHDAFTKAAHQKPLKDYLDTYVEHRALSTKAVKGMTLEEAAKVSSKLKAEIDSLKASEYERGKRDGKNLPPGEPPVNGRSVGSSTYGSEHALNAAYNDPTNPLHNDHARYASEYERITGRKP